MHRCIVRRSGAYTHVVSETPNLISHAHFNLECELACNIIGANTLHPCTGDDLLRLFFHIDYEEEQAEFADLNGSPIGTARKRPVHIEFRIGDRQTGLHQLLLVEATKVIEQTANGQFVNAVCHAAIEESGRWKAQGRGARHGNQLRCKKRRISIACIWQSNTRWQFNSRMITVMLSMVSADEPNSLSFGFGMDLKNFSNTFNWASPPLPFSVSVVDELAYAICFNICSCLIMSSS